MDAFYSWLEEAMGCNDGVIWDDGVPVYRMYLSDDELESAIMSDAAWMLDQ